MPRASVTFTGEAADDPRSYRVKFDRLSRVLPDFRLEYTLASGMAELHRKYVEHGFKAADFEGEQFVRLRTLRKRLSKLPRATEGTA